MTPEQRYQLDTFGFLHIEGALSPAELSAAQAAADRYITAAMTQPDVLPPGFQQDPKDGRRCVCHASPSPPLISSHSTDPSSWRTGLSTASPSTVRSSGS